MVVSCGRCDAKFARLNAREHDNICPNAIEICPDCGTEHRRIESANHSATCCGYHLIFKITLVGSEGAGKSCLLLRFTDRSYKESYIATIGVDFKIRTIELDGKVVRLQIWDFASNQRYRVFDYPTHYFRYSHGIMGVYDITDQKSFYDIQKWLLDSANLFAYNPAKLLIGCKADLHHQRQVTAGKAFADTLNIPFLETSAKTGENVERSFLLLAASIKESIKEETVRVDTRMATRLEDGKETKTGIGGCIFA